MMIKWEDDPELNKYQKSQRKKYAGEEGWIGMKFSGDRIAFVHKSGYKFWFKPEEMNPVLKDILKRKFPEVFL